MSDPPRRVDVVVPALNEAAEVAACVASARAIACDRLGVGRVVVADGGSADATVAEARGAGAEVVLAPAGRGAQLRAGVAATDADVVLMLHADNRLPPRGGRQLADALGAGARVGFFRQRIDAPGRRFRVIERGNAWRGRVLRLPYGDQAIFVERALLDRVGGVPDLPLMEDVALMQRVRRHARPVLLDGPIEVSARRWRENGVVRQTARNWALLAAFLLGVPAARLAPRYRPPSHARRA